MNFSIQSLKVGKRLMVVIVIASVVVLVQAAIGIYEMDTQNYALKNVYEKRMKPVEDLGTISNLMLENRTYLRIALSEVSINVTEQNTSLEMNQDQALKSADAIEQNIEKITNIWKSYMASGLTAEEQSLADRFAENRSKFVKEALKPSIIALRAGDYEAAKALSGKARELYSAAGPSLETLTKFQSNAAAQSYQDAVMRFDSIRTMTLLGLLGATALLVFLGLIITRSITKPLQKSIEVFNKIAEGNFETPIDAQGKDELSIVLQSLKSMQAKLKKDIGDQRVLAAQVADQSTLYENQ